MKDMGEGIRSMMFHTDIVRMIYDELLNYRYNRRFFEASKEIKNLQNVHKGERCFIVATGPSINKTDFNLIKNETIFGVNTLYKTLDKIKIKCKYYLVSDRVIWNDNSKELMDINTTLFLCYVASRQYFKTKTNSKKDPFLIKGKKTISLLNSFPKDISKYVYVNGPTVVFIALQIAYYLGFKEVYLLGCDSTYSGKAHFDGSAAPLKGTPEKEHWDLVLKAYEVCKNVYEADNRKIYNATVGGCLETFERVSLEDIMNESD